MSNYTCLILVIVMKSVGGFSAQSTRPHWRTSGNFREVNFNSFSFFVYIFSNSNKVLWVMVPLHLRLLFRFLYFITAFPECLSRNSQFSDSESDFDDHISSCPPPIQHLTSSPALISTTYFPFFPTSSHQTLVKLEIRTILQFQNPFRD